MTVFGRDTLITCLQTLLFGPELARTALERARRAAGARRTTRRSTPSRGRSSTRCGTGKAARNWFARYYGTVDATPLYLVLLSEVWRWTDDAALVRELQASRRCAALAWIDECGDRDGDGFVEYERRTRARAREPVVEGLVATRSASTTARSRRAPIAPCEVQGYVYDAKRRHGRARARGRGATATLAERLEREADELQQRFDEAFWVEERGGYYALALDGEKRQVDSLSSNIGHLLWSGIVPPERVDAVVDQLMGDGALVGLGRAHDVDRRRGLQPALRTTTARSGRTTTP